jgi:hypothetical protein
LIILAYVWRKQPMKEYSPLPVHLLLLALIGGGLLGGITNFLLLPNVWPWLMPPLAHRFLAAAAFSIFLSSLITWRRSRWLETEFILVNVLAYAIPLLLATFLDIALIDFRKPVTLFYFFLVITAVIICLIYLWQTRSDPTPNQTLRSHTRTFLLVLGILSGVVGLLVFAAPKQAGFVWPWAVLAAWKPLDSRLIASMLIMIAVGSFLARWRNDRGAWQLTAFILWTYCVVVGVSLGLHAIATPALLIADVTYIFIFVMLILSSLYLYLQERVA